jgi:hypothetical protein
MNHPCLPIHPDCRRCASRLYAGCHGVRREQFVGHAPCFETVRNSLGLFDRRTGEFAPLEKDLTPRGQQAGGLRLEAVGTAGSGYDAEDFFPAVAQAPSLEPQAFCSLPSAPARGRGQTVAGPGGGTSARSLLMTPMPTAIHPAAGNAKAGAPGVSPCARALAGGDSICRV